MYWSDWMMKKEFVTCFHWCLSTVHLQVETSRRNWAIYIFYKTLLQYFEIRFHINISRSYNDVHGKQLPALHPTCDIWDKWKHKQTLRDLVTLGEVTQIIGNEYYILRVGCKNPALFGFVMFFYHSILFIPISPVNCTSHCHSYRTRCFIY